MIKQYFLRKKYQWHLKMLERVAQQNHYYPSANLFRAIRRHQYLLDHILEKLNP